MDKHNACETAWLNGYKAGRESVEKKGAIDVAIVVRCKDCRHRGLDGFCPMYEAELAGYIIAEDNDFCSFGERKHTKQK